VLVRANKFGAAITRARAFAAPPAPFATGTFALDATRVYVAVGTTLYGVFK
jgi:hypothetical protein